MSGSDDPWSKWRKPEAPVAAEPEKKRRSEASPAEKPASTVNRENRPKSKMVDAAPVRAARAEQPAKPVETSDEAPSTPSGTLGVRRSANPAPRAPGKLPLRGGSSLRKPFVPKPPRDEADASAGGKSAAKSAPKSAWGAKTERSDRPERAARPKPAAAPPKVAVVRDGPAPEGVRLSKVMSERGLCSRREADLWIERGWVFVNGEQVSELGTRIDPQSSEITVTQDAKKDQAKAVTFLLHKPVGYVSGQPEPDCVPAVTLITAENQMPHSGGPEFKPWMLRGLAPAGRLDVDSTGLLVLTSDGRVAKRLIGEDTDTEKEYLVRVSGEMIKGGLDLLRHGLELDGKALKPAWVKQLNEDQLHFILKEGKKRQIRRMCELVGLKVIGLKRVRIGRIRLGDLPMGQWRFLREGEAF